MLWEQGATGSLSPHTSLQSARVGQAALLGVGKEKLGMAGIGLLCCRDWVCLTREGSRHCW